MSSGVGRFVSKNYSDNRAKLNFLTVSHIAEPFFIYFSAFCTVLLPGPDGGRNGVHQFSFRNFSDISALILLEKRLRSSSAQRKPS